MTANQMYVCIYGLNQKDITKKSNLYILTYWLITNLLKSLKLNQQIKQSEMITDNHRKQIIIDAYFGQAPMIAFVAGKYHFCSRLKHSQ